MRTRNIPVAICLVLLASARVWATSLIGFTDTSPNTGAFAYLWGGPGNSDEGHVWGVSWTQSVAASQVSVSALISNVSSDPAAMGMAFLTNALGPGTSAANEIAAPVSFTAPLVDVSDTTGEPYVTLFSGLTLGPGTYYLTLIGPVDATLANPFNWVGDFNGVGVSLAPGFSLGSYFYACNDGVVCHDSISSFLPASSFNVDSGPDLFFFSVDSSPTSIPEPASAILVLTGAALAARSARRRRFAAISGAAR